MTDYASSSTCTFSFLLSGRFWEKELILWSRTHLLACEVKRTIIRWVPGGRCPTSLSGDQQLGAVNSSTVKGIIKAAVERLFLRRMLHYIAIRFGNVFLFWANLNASWKHLTHLICAVQTLQTMKLSIKYWTTRVCVQRFYNHSRTLIE